MKYRIRMNGQTIWLTAHDIRHLEWAFEVHRKGGAQCGETVTDYCRITEVADNDDDKTRHLMGWGIFDNRNQLMIDRLKQVAIYADRTQAASYCDDDEHVESVYIEYGCVL